jgi:hypothetical protein|tara:strand:- start:2629 stop:3354 length:726 start_codon:yes stop_codon:yes gene_type:complete
MGVSRRTIFRDLNLLREAGVDLLFDVDKSTYRLAEPMAHRRSAGSKEELAVVADTLIGNQFSLWTALQNDPVDDASQIPLLNLFPADQKIQLSRLLNACQIYWPSKVLTSLEADLIKAVMYAITHEKRMKLLLVGDHHCRHGLDDLTEEGIWTVFAPFSICLHPSGWIFTGESKLHQSVCAISLCDIHNAVHTQQRYTIPQTFNRRRTLELIDSGGIPNVAAFSKLIGDNTSSQTGMTHPK